MNLTRQQQQAQFDKLAHNLHNAEKDLLGKISNLATSTGNEFAQVKSLVEKHTTEISEREKALLKTLQTLEETQSLDRKMAEDGECNGQHRMGGLEKRLEAVEERERERNELNHQRFHGIEKRLGFVETDFGSRMRGLEERQEEHLRLLKEKIDADISSVCDTLEAMQSKQERANKKFETGLLEQKGGLENLKGTVENKFRELESAVGQRVQVGNE